MRYKIIETDNFGGDYPDEKFVNLPAATKEEAERLADLINEIYPRRVKPRRFRAGM
jgi:hypothetical protein